MDVFLARMKEMRDTVKGSRPAAGFDEVLIAGDPEWRTEANRRRDGRDRRSDMSVPFGSIDVDEFVETQQDLAAVGHRLIAAAWAVAGTLKIDGKNPIAVALGRKGGLKGGAARAQALTKSQRSDIAKHAALVRWGKEK